jgi:hypothetical protein
MNVVVAVPAWPSLIISEGTAALEAVIPVDKPGTAHAKRMATTKIGSEMVVGNATIEVAIVPFAVEAVVPTVVSDGVRHS